MGCSNASVSLHPEYRAIVTQRGHRHTEARERYTPTRFAQFCGSSGRHLIRGAVTSTGRKVSSFRLCDVKSRSEETAFAADARGELELFVRSLRSEVMTYVYVRRFRQAAIQGGLSFAWWDARYFALASKGRHPIFPSARTGAAE